MAADEQNCGFVAMIERARTIRHFLFSVHESVAMSQAKYGIGHAEVLAPG